jgi:hypothetical protein
MYIQIYLFLKEINYVQLFTTLNYVQKKINYVQKINEFKVQRIGFREYDTTYVPWTSDDFVKEELEKLTIYW